MTFSLVNALPNVRISGSQRELQGAVNPWWNPSVTGTISKNAVVDVSNPIGSATANSRFFFDDAQITFSWHGLFDYTATGDIQAVNPGYGK
jgi:hypothetical protein